MGAEISCPKCGSSDVTCSENPHNHVCHACGYSMLPVMGADEAAVRAVAEVLRSYKQKTTPMVPVAPDWPRLARAVLATPVVADWRRDAELLAKVQAIVDEPIYQAEVKAVQLVRYHRIADMVGGQS